MYRDIIFRAKRLDNGEWVESRGLLTHKDGTIIMVFSQEEKHVVTGPIIPETVGQYTGFIHRGKTKIFEDDVFIDEIEMDYGDERIPYIVKWISEKGAFTLLTEGDWNDYKTKGIKGIEESFEGFGYELDQKDLDKMIYKGPVDPITMNY